jgi:hypothetical protein
MTDLRTIADAVLYEGYMLWPYRPSALKNRRRWTFGCVFPPAWTALHPDDACLMRTQVRCLSDPSAVEVTVRFLHEGVERSGEIDGLARVDVSIDDSRLTVLVRNVSEWAGDDREEALRHSLCSTQTLLRGGRFVSATEAEGCENIGTWPVLVGDDAMLSAPIILEDHPRIAPESPGDLFDGGEIDGLLALNILALTDDEKAEMRAADPRTREILERTESLTREQLLRLSGYRLER